MLVALALTAAGCDGCSPESPDAPAALLSKPAGGFLKGQLHAHSSRSADSHTAPPMVVRWYSRRGYDFLVITDHNRLTRVGGTGSTLALPGVELTINQPRCEPPPEPGGECLIHMDALLPRRALSHDPWEPPEASLRREDLYGEELAEAQAAGAIAQLNHPNYGYAADAALLTKLAARGVTLVEIANQSSDTNNDGDATHPSTEELWDEALTAGARLFGTATDDAHDYYDDPADAPPGADTGDRGFVMVRAEPTQRSIRQALLRGDFYATTGVLLDRLEMSADLVVIEATGEEPVWFEAVGEHGVVLRREQGRSFRFEPRSMPSSYVRVRVTDATSRRAWTQPLFVSDEPL